MFRLRNTYYWKRRATSCCILDASDMKMMSPNIYYVILAMLTHWADKYTLEKSRSTKQDASVSALV